jgi:hypothetical protein
MVGHTSLAKEYYNKIHTSTYPKPEGMSLKPETDILS